MKHITLILVLSFLLQACQVFMPTPIETLAITFSPTVIPSDIEAQFPYFEVAFKEALREEGYDLKTLKLSVEATNQLVEDRVRAGLTDIAYMRINNYLAVSEQAQSFLTVSQKGYVFDELSAYQNINERPELELTTHQRSLILATPSTYGLELKRILSTTGALSWIDLNQAKWCHVIVTSYEGYIYPSLWLIDHYQRRISELFKHELVVFGYRELIERSALEECDVIMGPYSIRDDYESQWITLRKSINPEQTQNIYQDLYPIGMTQAYYNDLFVASKLSTNVDEKVLEAVRKAFIQLHTNQHALFKTLNIEGFMYVENERYTEMLDAYEFLREITR